MKNENTNISKMSRRRMLTLLGRGAAALAASAAAFSSARAKGSDSSDTGDPPLLNTRLTREYGVRFPFVGAGMGFASYPPLVAAVSNAGGIGVLGNAVEPPASTQLLIQMIKSMTPNLFGADFIDDMSAFGPMTTPDHIDVCIQEGVRLVVFHQAVPRKSFVDALKGAGINVWFQAPSVERAVAAAKLGIDAIIAQGQQAGGHNLSTTRTIKLLHEISEAVHPLLVLASGGIATGADVVAALANGAEGVWVGTRLVASTEAYAHDNYKQRLLQAAGHATAVTTAFGPEWPNQSYRLLRTELVAQVAGHEDQLPPIPSPIGQTVLFPFTLRVPYTMPAYSAVVPSPDTSGQFELMGFPAGEDSVKKIKDIKPAGEIVVEMMEEARQIIEDIVGRRE